MVGNRVERKVGDKTIWTRKLIKEHINEPYVQKVIIINKHTIKAFIRPEWHRDFREQHISAIKNSILAGNHFNETITVNTILDKYRVLNGNHRTEALRRVLEIYPNFSTNAIWP